MHKHTWLASLLVALGCVCTILRGAQTAQISTEASSHLTEIISVLEREWLHRGRMDWGNFRKRVFQQAGAAETIPDTYDAIRVALSFWGTSTAISRG